MDGLKRWRLWCITLIVLFQTGILWAGPKYVRVKSVTDGDTIVLENQRKVRYLGINCPEIGSGGDKLAAYGQQAKRLNIKLVQGKLVRLEYDKEQRDRYERHLAYVYLKDGTFINQRLLAEGLASCYPTAPNNRYQQEFLAEQQRAMKADKGLWKAISRKGPARVGNRRSYRFHTKKCDLGAQISRKNRVQFSSSWEAYWNGFAACGKCQPD